MLASCVELGPERQASTESMPAFQLFVAPQTLRSDEVSLLWDKAAASASGLTYVVLCDEKPIGSTTKTHFTAKNLLPEHTYAFAVTAYKGAKSVRSTKLEVHTPAKEPVVSVRDFGAKGDGKTLDTKAIQAAIDACPPHGVVAIPAGTFLSGALYLKSDLTLQIDAGGVLQGSASPADYEPLILNRFEGWEMKTYASLLNAGRLDRSGPANVHNLSIRGQGKISGGSKRLADAIIRTHGLRARGRLICLMNCADVEVQGLTLENTPCWTLHYIYSERVSCHDLTITSNILNGDGLDPDSSKDSFIFNCTFSTGDDCIAIKSGKNPEGNVVNRPTENVRIVDCRFTEGHGISIGSEMSGGVRNVLVEDCVAGKLLHGLQIKGTKDRGGFVDGVTVRDCDLQKITIFTALDYNNDGKPAPEQPYFRNFRFTNIDLTNADAKSPVIVVNGFSAPGHRTQHVAFEKIKLPADAKVTVDQAEDVTFANVLTATGEKPSYAITRSDRVVY